MIGKRLGMLIGGAICAAAISACGAGEHATYSDNLGPAQGFGIETELTVHALSLKLPVADEWFGVSMQVYNWTSHAHAPTGDFFITDTLGDRYTPLVNPTPNSYTYVPASIPANGQLPAIDSDAYTGWSQGEFLIFKIPYASLVNRPFILHIVNPYDSSLQSRIELDV